MLGLGLKLKRWANLGRRFPLGLRTQQEERSAGTTPAKASGSSRRWIRGRRQVLGRKSVEDHDGRRRRPGLRMSEQCPQTPGFRLLMRARRWRLQPRSTSPRRSGNRFSEAAGGPQVTICQPTSYGSVARVPDQLVFGRGSSTVFSAVERLTFRSATWSRSTSILAAPATATPRPWSAIPQLGHLAIPKVASGTTSSTPTPRPSCCRRRT